MSIQEKFLEAIELYRQALNALRHNQESGGLEGGDKLRFTKQLIKSKNELQNLSSDLVKQLRPEAAELVLELIEYTTQSVWLDQRFYDLHPKVNAIVKASALVPAAKHPYKQYFDTYVEKHPRARYPEAEAAKSYWRNDIDKHEKQIWSEGKSKEEAEKTFVRKFKRQLKK